MKLLKNDQFYRGAQRSRFAGIDIAQSMVQVLQGASMLSDAKQEAWGSNRYEAYRNRPVKARSVVPADSTRTLVRPVEPPTAAVHTLASPSGCSRSPRCYIKTKKHSLVCFQALGGARRSKSSTRAAVVLQVLLLKDSSDLAVRQTPTFTCIIQVHTAPSRPFKDGEGAAVTFWCPEE